MPPLYADDFARESINRVLISAAAERRGGGMRKSVISSSAQSATRGCVTAGPTGCLDVGHSAGGSLVVGGEWVGGVGGRH